jgi:hypothetical protein
MGFSIGGSVLGGLLAKRLELLDAVAVALAVRVLPQALRLHVAATAGAVVVGAFSPTVVLGTICAEALAGGVLSTCMFAWMMAQVDKNVGARDPPLFIAPRAIFRSFWAMC